ncbi:PilX N-terminal domain-containing pilus assembly protein [Pseudoxanthomonas sp. LjRoot168]|uniref:pilus assembly PilX family protein n=1 Tax=unclassified Pseudoxanthomonas TaxID=2645906 RepID=UPI0026341B35|nr:PilX N-terminal domain-containing pilus assembly protein [uncultured Pseudoxanthomonas sp.]
MSRSYCRTSPAFSRSGQQGIALVVVLILLVVTAILGLVIMRSSAMQELMAANLRDRSVAFQAAEGALRFGQDQVLGVGNWDTQTPAVGSPCVNGVCPSGSAPAWTAVPANSYDNVLIPEAPEYWIEYIGTGPGQPGGCDSTSGTLLNCANPIYRVTARSRAAGRADVLVQATVISRIPDEP